MRFIIFLVLLMSLNACNESVKNVALGTLERDRIAHTATVNEVIVDLPAKQGSLVKKGQILVRLDNHWQRAQLAKAQADVQKAEANLDKLRNGARIEEVAAARANVSGAKATLQESQTNYERTLKLVTEKMASKATLDHSLAKRDASSAHLQSAIESLRQLTNGTRPEDLAIGEANLHAAQAILSRENKKLADLTITATRSGRLDSLPWNLGERVTSGSPLAIIVAGKAPYARVYIPEPYRVKINTGDKLSVYVDGIKDAIIGTVRWIATDPAFTPYYALNQEERARLMYLAEIQLPDSASNLPNGVPAQVALP